MFGPLCNACYLFLRTKGFMRPPAVVKKYLQQQRYKKEQRENSKSRLDSISSAKGESSSSPFPRFVTPSHTPSMINQVIQNNRNKGKPVNNSNYDLNEFMNQLNAFGGPLTDIDPSSLNPGPNLIPGSSTCTTTRKIRKISHQVRIKMRVRTASLNDSSKSHSVLINSQVLTASGSIPFLLNPRQKMVINQHL